MQPNAGRQSTLINCNADHAYRGPLASSKSSLTFLPERRHQHVVSLPPIAVEAEANTASLQCHKGMQQR